MAKEEEDDDYRPYDTLKAIGFTKDDAKGFLSSIEADAASQLPEEPKKAPDMEVKFSVQKAQIRHSRIKYGLLIVGGFAFAVWLYVIAVQFLYPDWIYESFATWLPIRMDYVGEAAFVISFIVLVAFAMEHSKRPKAVRREADADTEAKTPEDQ